MLTDEHELRYLANSSFKTVNWRMEYAQQLLNQPGGSCPESADPWVTRYLNHRSADKTTPYPSRTTKVKYDPYINRAEEVFRDLDNRKLRWYLEALLLTQEPLDQIARRCQLNVSTVEAYAAIFFDVRTRPGARDWLRIRAVRCDPSNNYAGAKEGGLWRLFALGGGIDVLEVVMAATGDFDWPTWLPTAAGSDDPEVIEQFKMKVRLTVEMVTATSEKDAQKLIAISKSLNVFEDVANSDDDSFSILKPMVTFLKMLARPAPGPHKIPTRQQSSASGSDRKTKSHGPQQSLPKLSKDDNPL